MIMPCLVKILDGEYYFSWRNMNFKINFSYRIGKMSMDQKPRRKKSVTNDDLKEGGSEAEMQQNK